MKRLSILALYLATNTLQGADLQHDRHLNKVFSQFAKSVIHRRQQGLPLFQSVKDLAPRQRALILGYRLDPSSLR